MHFFKHNDPHLKMVCWLRNPSYANSKDTSGIRHNYFQPEGVPVYAFIRFYSCKGSFATYSNVIAFAFQGLFTKL